MRMFEVPVKLASSVAPARTEELSERLGAGVFSRLPFELADGRRLERDVTQY